MVIQYGQRRVQVVMIDEVGLSLGRVWLCVSVCSALSTFAECVSRPSINHLLAVALAGVG
jgi:hypothetical protein